MTVPLSAPLSDEYRKRCVDASSAAMDAMGDQCVGVVFHFFSKAAPQGVEGLAIATGFMVKDMPPEEMARVVSNILKNTPDAAKNWAEMMLRLAGAAPAAPVNHQPLGTRSARHRRHH